MGKPADIDGFQAATRSAHMDVPADGGPARISLSQTLREDRWRELAHPISCCARMPDILDIPIEESVDAYFRRSGSMPRQRIRHSAIARVFPDDLPQRPER